ncbi:PglL family O-oligosaccharyltransferase [Alysiella filiformis]|uniref:O-antigen ligase n=1 Tax=Alysiella filiformis DSM 16848 TaxID=1120981 RepID=A0A286E1S4_9NEIS|nr:PglL family O-oligosaccharyltransferase [Alysiella filiformis]QMT30796.1 O-antigen ligase C-terminal domain-containing protein [Alysiella filiformis]UBQ56223.1 PglL family O-oligosaccharyltransferase [Alysiella filiformis DSM 16848]SOD64857.1 O-antigen ligase [Alysiella filiformis DSM 16848]
MTNNQSLWRMALLPVWVGFVLIAAVPFLSIWRTGPQLGFFIESGSLLFVLLFVLASVLLGKNLSGSLKNVPRASWYFLAMAAFWAIQARALNVVYVGLSDVVAWIFVGYALLAWACRAWIKRVGQEPIVAILAWALVLGALAQSVVGWLQYTDLAGHFSGYLMYRQGIVEGQLGQRNHFGHYMMWGVLSCAWLWGQKRLHGILALILLMNFSAVMALTGSRTIFAYVLGLALLLPVWRVFADKSHNRHIATLALAGIGVVLAQFFVEDLMRFFSQNAALESAAERLNNHAFGGSGRNYEWQKAWQIFLSAPLWGHGWGSYAYQGFLLDVYPNGFRPYETNVLFTHSHNSFLNLLAEMGLLGTVLVLGGMVWAISGSLKQPRSSASLLLLALMSVSLLHSVLEYPLWYVYFLSAFALFICLHDNPPNTENTHSGSLKREKIGIALATALCLAMLAGTVRLAFAYADLNRFARTGGNLVEKNEKIMGLRHISQTQPILRYYADLSLLEYLNPHSTNQPKWAYRVARDNALFRPYANAHHWGFTAYQQGEIETAQQWLQHMYRYYPSKMPYYGSIVMNAPHYPKLRDDYTRICQDYYRRIQQTSQCAEGLPPNPQTKAASRQPEM